jgi:hypothetical protein
MRILHFCLFLLVSFSGNSLKSQELFAARQVRVSLERNSSALKVMKLDLKYTISARSSRIIKFSAESLIKYPDVRLDDFDNEKGMLRIFGDEFFLCNHEGKYYLISISRDRRGFVSISNVVDGEKVGDAFLFHSWFLYRELINLLEPSESDFMFADAIVKNNPELVNNFELPKRKNNPPQTKQGPTREPTNTGTFDANSKK